MSWDFVPTHLQNKRLEFEMKAIRAIVPAAGKRSRLQKISGDLPKAMFPVGKRPMLEFVLENISFIDEKNIYIVVGYGKEKIMNHFGIR